jgi:hypothetical protein
LSMTQSATASWFSTLLTNSPNPADTEVTRRLIFIFRSSFNGDGDGDGDGDA